MTQNIWDVILDIAGDIELYGIYWLVTIANETIEYDLTVDDFRNTETFDALFGISYAIRFSIYSNYAGYDTIRMTNETISSSPVGTTPLKCKRVYLRME